MSTRSEKVKEGFVALANSPIIRFYRAARQLFALIPVCKDTVSKLATLTTPHFSAAC